MWPKYRFWKHILIIPLAVVIWWMFKGLEKTSEFWNGGVIFGALLAVLYLGEEIIWIAKGKGRPCNHCCEKVKMKSFRVISDCPHCGAPID